MNWMVRHIVWACARKRKLRSKLQASVFARKEGARTGKTLNFYRCPICGFWHLTSRPAYGQPHDSPP